MTPGHDSPGIIARRTGGVALNVANALLAQGTRPMLMSVIGQDLEGQRLIEDLTGAGIDCGFVTRVNEPTDSYLAIEGPDGEVFAAIADCQSLERAGSSLLAPLRDGRLGSEASGYDGLAVIDGNLPEYVLSEIANGPLLANAKLFFVPASPGKADRMRAIMECGRGTLFINRIEAEILMGESYPTSREAAKALAAKCGGAVVTDGPREATISRDGNVLSVTPPEVKVAGVTGAGDAFLAGFLAGEVDGEHPASCLIRAADAAAAHISGKVE